MTEQDEGFLIIYARLMAVQTAVIALLRTSAEPLLAQTLEREIEKMKSVLLANPLPDRCIDAFDQQLVPIRKAVK